MSMAKELCTSALPSLTDNQTTLFVSSLTIIMTFMVISVILRLVSRHLSAARFGADDYTIIGAAVSLSGVLTSASPSCMHNMSDGNLVNDFSSDFTEFSGYVYNFWSTLTSDEREINQSVLDYRAPVRLRKALDNAKL